MKGYPRLYNWQMVPVSNALLYLNNRDSRKLKMNFFLWTSVTFLPMIQAIAFPSVGFGFTARKVSYTEEKLVDNMTTWIQNQTVKTYVSAHLLFCPNQDMCFGDQFKRNYTYQLKVRSCSFCGCNDDCHRKKNCCPWRLYVQNRTNTPPFITYKDHNFLTPSRYNNISLDCIRPSVNFEDEDIHGYFMISKCPDGFTNEDLVKKCQGLDHKKDFRVFQPVTSLHSNETFKNLDCALCNAESPESLVFWEAQLNCKMSADIFQLNSVEELQKRVFAPLPTCNIIFNPPSFVLEDRSKACIKQGSFIIKKCNDTSEWRVYSASIEKGCNMDYVDPYTHCKEFGSKSHKIYKNIFCAMCNVNNWTSELVTECIEQFYLDSDHMSSFSALLDVRGIYKEEAYQRCAIYDPLLKTCHHVVCEAGMKYENSECVPIHKQINQQIYEINVLATPTYRNNVSLMNSQIDFITTIRKDEEIFEHLCFAQTLTANPENIDNNSGFYLMIYTKLSVSEFHDLKKFTERMIEKFRFTQRLRNNFKIEIISQSFKSRYNTAKPQHFSNPGESVTECFLNPMSQDVIHGIFTLKGKNKELKCTTDDDSSSIITIAPVTICPRIVIHKSQTKVVVSNFTLCFADFGFCLESRYFKESSDRSQVEVCLSQYLERVSISAASLTEEKVLSVICLSLSSFGCLGSVVTFIIFDEVKHLHGLNMIGLSITLFLANTIYTFSRVSSIYPTLCVSVGALTHFLWLSVMMWMTVSSLPIFRAFTSLTVKKSESRSVRHRLLFNVFCSFLIPVLMVFANILISLFVYHDSNYGYSMITCYISRTELIIYTFAIPIAVMVTLNMFMFILTVREINAKRVTPVVKSDTDRQMILIFCRLSTITGGAWVFGFLHQFFQIQLFSYLHILITGSQGLFIFFAFGVRLIFKNSPKRDPTTNSTLTS